MLAKTYKIETDRLVIRCYTPQDAALLKQAIDDSIAHLSPKMPWARNEPQSIETKTARLRKYRGEFDLGLNYTFGVFSKDGKHMIGSSGLHTRLGDNEREIGYWINANHIRQGYATETVKGLTRVGFEIEGLDKIEIRCDPDNVGSQAVARKAGYVHERTFTEKPTDEGEASSEVMVWSMSREQYGEQDFSGFEVRGYDVVGRRIG